jgi:AraC family transcriptional regulator, regulatory protein of adaptative response / methylated-DNA-[protein]-cysteine methyltransferase
MIVRTAEIETPIGACWLAVSADGVCALGLGPPAPADLARRLARRWPLARFEPARDPDGVATRIVAYFSGDRALSDVPLDLGGTPFQARVWKALRAIPLGTTLSYADLALGLGTPRAVRAVARANATNPVSLAVPCHRVIGKDGGLTGYAWGTERKAWLLAHEARWRVAADAAGAAARAVTSAT